MTKFLFIITLLVAVKITTAQSLDPTFNGTGMITGSIVVDGINEFDSPVDIIYDHNTGNIVMLNQLNNYGGALHRYTPSGEIDLSYGIDGVALFELGGLENRVLNLFEKADGYDIAGFISATDDHYSPFLMKTNFDGTVKTDFGIDGVNAVYEVGYLISYMASQGPSGKTALAGWNYQVVFGDPGAGLMRFNADGSYDSVFNYITFGIEGHTEFNTTIQLADGRQMAAGFTYNATHDTTISFIAVFDDEGELDPGFGDGGLFFPKPTIEYRSFVFRQLEQDAAGNIYVLGNINLPSDYQLIVVKFDPDGNLITSFGDQGFAYLENNDFIEPKDILVSPSFEVYVLGNDHPVDDATNDTNIFKLKADGSIDASFTNGQPGKFLIDIADTEEDIIGYQIIMQPDGKLVVTGRVEGLSANTDHFVCRIAPTVVGIAADENKHTLQISPNPVADIFEIKSDFDIAHISIIDCNGHECMNISIEDKTNVNIGALPAGLYFIRATYIDGSSDFRNFIKM